MIEEQNPSCVSAFISVRGRIRKEMGKDGKGEAGIENRGKGTLSSLSLNHFTSKESKISTDTVYDLQIYSLRRLKLKPKVTRDMILPDILTYSIHTYLALKLVNPSATSKCRILYLSFPHRLHCLVTQQL